MIVIIILITIVIAVLLGIICGIDETFILEQTFSDHCDSSAIKSIVIIMIILTVLISFCDHGIRNHIVIKSRPPLMTAISCY